PSTGVALGAGVMVSVAIGLGIVAEINCRHVLRSGRVARMATGDLATRPPRPGVRRGYSALMPTRATKRGDERTSLAGTHDVLICGASFAGLAVARELAGSGAHVLIPDRYR